MLERETAYWAQHAAEWAMSLSGRFLVVKDEALLGDFATIDEALAAGAARFGMQPFLVRQAGQAAEVVSIPALTLGLLSAHP